MWLLIKGASDFTIDGDHVNVINNTHLGLFH